MKALWVVALGLALVACGGQGPGETQSKTVYIQVTSGDNAIYLVSDNLDPKSWPDDAASHKVSGLPDGSVQVCNFKTSQGVSYKVWSTGTADSTSLARDECQRMGQ